MNNKARKILEFIVLFPMMILSCGVSGAFLLRLQLSPLYFSVLRARKPFRPYDDKQVKSIIRTEYSQAIF
jgi:hypothetical protein